MAKKIVNSEHGPAEKKFIRECKKLNIYYEADDDGMPIVRPAGKKNRNFYKIGVFDNKHCDVVILTEHGRTKKKFIDKLVKRKIEFEVRVDCDTDAQLLFKFKDLKRVAFALNANRKTNRKPPPKEVYEAALIKARQARKEKNR